MASVLSAKFRPTPSSAPLPPIFFEERGWPTTDGRGRGQRAVIERVDPTNPARTKRLRGEQTIDAAGLENGAILRIFPEAIAGIVDERSRIAILIQDHNGMQELAEWNPHITFDAKPSDIPTFYDVRFDYPGFKALGENGHTPIITTDHRVEITLGAEYPQRALRVRWMTPIFHPNIDPDSGGVCLGVLLQRYLPGLGLARLVTMLAEMIQYRNFDMSNALNRVAAAWSAKMEHWPFIQEIGGSPFQGPVHELLKQLEEAQHGSKRPRRQFRRLSVDVEGGT